MNDEILDGTVIDPNEPEPNASVEALKSITGLIVVTTVGTTVNTVIKAAIPDDISGGKRLSIKIGSWLLSGYIATLVDARVCDSIDNLYDSWKAASVTLHGDTPAG